MKVTTNLYLTVAQNSLQAAVKLSSLLFQIVIVKPMKL